MPTRLEALVKTALLGTERRPLSAADLAAIGWVPATADPAQTALEALAAAQLQLQAGFRLADAPDQLPEPAPFDDRPVCGPFALRLLQTLLTGLHSPALPEFIDLLAMSGQRLPPEVLPDILHKSLENRLLSGQLEALLGPVGHWLARQRLRWRALLPDPQADWFTASRADRQRLLLAMRRRSPLVALAWLEATWSQESSQQQVKFLETLAYGLSSFDEPLLRRATADKQEAVRITALRLLDLLPLSPAEILRLATARQPDYIPATGPPERWPEPARLALLTSSSFPPALLAGVWPGLLAQLSSPALSAAGFTAVEQVAKIVAYLAELSSLEADLQQQGGQLHPDTRQLFSNILAFRRQVVSALQRPEPAG